MSNGLLVVLEGPDGVGKTSLCLALQRCLRETGIEADLYSFPGKEEGTLGSLVYRLHHNSTTVGISYVSATSLQMLHVAAHLDAIESRLLPALANGKVVILDRYWWSTWVYGREAGVPERHLDAMIRCEILAWGHAFARLLILVDRKSALRSADELSFSKRRGLYRRIARREGKRFKVVVLNNDRPFDETVEELARTVSLSITSSRGK